MFRSIFMFLFPVIILICVTGQVENSGIEYYGTSNVRVQTPEATPTNQPQTQPPLINGPLQTPTVAAPEQPMDNDSQLPVVEIGAQPSVTSQAGPVYVSQSNVVATSHSPSQSNAGSQPTTVASIRQPEEIVTLPPKQYDDQPPIINSHVPSSFLPALSATTASELLIVPVDSATQTPKGVENRPRFASSQPAEVFSPNPPAGTTPQPAIVAVPQQLYENSPEITFEVENPPSVSTSQPTGGGPQPGAGASQPPVQVTPSQVAANHQPTHLQAPEFIPPAIGSNYPLGPLPPLLPKPKPVRQPDFIWYTQPTPVYPTSYTTHASIVTRVPPVVVPTRSPPKQDESSKLDCKEENGFYAIRNECDTYIECQQYIAKRYTCPDGLHFNSDARWTEYPCAYPSEVKCNSGIENLNPRPTNQCPRQYGFFSMNDGDCSKYIMCQGGIATIMNCPAGLVFNPNTDTCDWQINVPECNPNVFKDFTCPEAPVDEYGYLSDVIYKYKYQNQCKLYIACQKGHPRLLSCEIGLAFDEISQSCIKADYVAGCSTATAYRG